MTNRFILVGAILFASLMAPTKHAGACQFDTDCQPGSNCIKSIGQIYGICVGGSLPGNRYDSVPVFAPLDLNRSYGNTCQFDVDCGPGSKCVKSSGSINGTCVR
jgi:hypothetical protein